MSIKRFGRLVGIRLDLLKASVKPAIALFVAVFVIGGGTAYAVVTPAYVSCSLTHWVPLASASRGFGGYSLGVTLYGLYDNQFGNFCYREHSEATDTFVSTPSMPCYDFGVDVRYNPGGEIAGSYAHLYHCTQGTYTIVGPSVAVSLSGCEYGYTWVVNGSGTSPLQTQVVCP